MTRNIVATLLRKNKPVFTRRYARVDTAVPRLSQVMMLEAQPRDVVELSHAVTGLWIGSIIMRVHGKLESTWIWDQDV